MVLGMRGMPDGLSKGMGLSTQLSTQAAAVTAVAYIESGAIARADNVITLNKSGILAATIDHPDAGRILVIEQIDSGTDGHTVTLAAGTFDGTNNTATFNAQYETLFLLGISSTRFLILLNIGSVALSSV